MNEAENLIHETRRQEKAERTRHEARGPKRIGAGRGGDNRQGYVEKDYLVLRASASRPSGKKSDDDYHVLADGVVVGRIFKVRVGGRTPWMWTLPRGTTRTAHPHTAMRRRARLRWRLLQRAGGGSNRAGTPGAPMCF